MTPSKKILLPVAALAAGSLMFAIGAGEHDGHDHAGHSHDHDSNAVSAEEEPGGNAIVVAVDEQSELGVEIAEAPLRAFGESTGEVTAVPKGSVFREDGKLYVLALSEGRDDSFEKWEVSLGASDDFFVEAKTGVFPGDRIVVAGLESIRDSANAEIVSESVELAAVSTGETIGKTRRAKSSDVCPLDRRGACASEYRSTERSPRRRAARAGFRECDVIVVEDRYDPHFHGYTDSHRRPYGYRGW